MDITLDPNKYRLAREIRPFSYSVALITCGLGVLLAYIHGYESTYRAVLVILAGILLQAAVNLMNNFGEHKLWLVRRDADAQLALKLIFRNNRLGILCGLLACGMGILLVLETGWPLLLLGIFGVIGGYGYTGEPINYKARGLGVALVFLFMGELMIIGAYYAVTGVWDLRVLALGLPVSLLSSALLLSNELRDVEEDLAANVKTLTVRIGFPLARSLYLAMMTSVYIVSLVLYMGGSLNTLWFLLPSLLVFWQPIKLALSTEPLNALPPITGRFFMIFGICFLACAAWG